ncbi:MAG: biotin--[acetyl-CoA-carboxylase] ligase [Fibrobacterota bacterium]
MRRRGKYIIKTFSSMGSTNSFLKENLSFFHDRTVIHADFQRAGRGRRGNCWVSPAGRDLTFSVLYYLNKLSCNTEDLSLIISVSICESLEKICLGGNFKLKWPNDVYVNYKKIAGILTEIVYSSKAAVAGCGINVNSTLEERNKAPDSVSLYEIDKKIRQPVEIMKTVLLHTEKNLEIAGADRNCFMKHANSFLFGKGRRVTASNPEEKINGKISGINAEGLLVVDNEKNGQVLLGPHARNLRFSD